MSTVDKIQFWLIHFLVIEGIVGLIIDCMAYLYGLNNLLEFMIYWVLFGALALFSGYIVYSNWKYVHDGMKQNDSH